MKKKNLSSTAKLALHKRPVFALTYLEANSLKGGSLQGHTGTTTCTMTGDQTFAGCDATASICQGLGCTDATTHP